MRATKSVQYTIRGIPADVDKALRRMAKAPGLSLNQVIVEELAKVVGRSASGRFRSMDGIAGNWADDPELERIVQQQPQIDDTLWQ